MQASIKIKFLLLTIIFSVFTSATSAPMVIPVTAAKLQEIAFYQIYDFPATVVSESDSILSAELSGKVIELPFKIGQAIKANDVLATIDCTEYEIGLNQAKAQLSAIQSDLEFAKWQLSRNKELAKQNNISKEAVVQANSTVAKLEASKLTQTSAIEQAQNRLNKCAIHSPFDATLVSKSVSIGEYVNPGSQMVRVVDTNNLEVEAMLHVSEVKMLTSIKNLQFKANNHFYPLNLRSIVQVKDSRTRTQVVRFEFTKEKPLPGTAGRLFWQAQKPAIPAEFIRQVNGDLGVFAIENNKAKFIKLPDAIEGQPATLNTDIPHEIILEGRYIVKDGSLLQVQNRDISKAL